MTLLFFQTGHYAEAYRRFAAGEEETYRDQRASVSFVADLAAAGHEVTTVSVTGPHEETLAPGLRSLGVARGPTFGSRAAGALLDRLTPDRLILRLPHLAMLQAAAARRIPTLPNFADLFARGGPRTWLTNRRLARLLRGRHIPCVSNHNLNASRTLVDVLGLDPARVVPWDWTRLQEISAPRPAPRDPAAPTAFYAGALSAAKGVEDCLAALATPPCAAAGLRMRFAGGGDLAAWRARAAELGVADRAEFIGLLPHRAVRAEMAAHDLVIVPSRHSYPEGLPNVIYEALAARTPLVLSDHPAFRGRLTPDRHCAVFAAGDPAALGATMARVLGDTALYARLSETASSGLESLYLGMEWSNLVTRFVDDPEDRTGRIAANSLAAIGMKRAG